MKRIILIKNRQNHVRVELSDYESRPQTGKLDYMISENKIHLAAKKLKNNKSSAYDRIKNEMIKSAFPFLSKSITHAFNMSLSTGKFPKSWKEGIVIPLHENGSQFDPNNYRGITLNSCFSKLFCHVLNNRITSELESMSFLKSQQAGFRRNHRTSDQIFILSVCVKLEKW